jgi:hypothetical protein
MTQVLFDSILEVLALLQKGDDGVDLCFREGSSCIPSSPAAHLALRVCAQQKKIDGI